MAWSSLAFLATFALALGLVIAIPVNPSFPEIRGLHKSSNLEARAPKFPRIKISKIAEEWATERDFKDAFSMPQYREKVFWSGNFDKSGKRASVLSTVVEMIEKEKRGRHTIEMALEKEELVMPPFDLKMEADGSQVWEKAMEVWVGGAQGDVDVFWGKLRPNNAFETFEKPILLKLLEESKVRRATVHNLVTDEKHPLQDRPSSSVICCSRYSGHN